MTERQAIRAIIAEHYRAECLHPDWPADIIHAVAIVAEESGEAVRAALQYVYEDGSLEDLRVELVQTAAMCIRTLVNMREEL